VARVVDLSTPPNPPAPPPGALRVLRWAEGVYALVALGLGLSLPPPTPGTAVAWVHWLGTAALAGTLSFRLRRPNRASWYVAALLATYVLASALPSAPRLGAMLRYVIDNRSAAGAFSLSLAFLVVATQAAAAISLYRLRALRHGADARGPSSFLGPRPPR